MTMNELRDQAEAPDNAPLLDEELVEALESILPRYFRAVRYTIEQAEGVERLTLSQYRCLQAIAAQGTTLTTRLAWFMGVTMPTMTSRIDGLVERGLVERQPDPHSRRQVLLRLTPAGQALLREYTGVVEGWLLSLLASLGSAQKEQMVAALKDLEHLLDENVRARAEQDATTLER